MSKEIMSPDTPLMFGLSLILIPTIVRWIDRTERTQ